MKRFIGAPDEILELNSVARGLQILMRLGVELRGVLLDCDAIARGQCRIGVPPHQHHQLPSAGAIALQSCHLGILT